MLLALILVIEANILVAWGQSICLNNGNYSSNSSYSVNLNAALSSLPANIDANGFYNVSVGRNPDRANVAVLCRGNIHPDTCRECLRNSSAELLNSCPNQKQAINWQELCMLRYSDETMHALLATFPSYWWWNPNFAASPAQFKDNLDTLMDYVRGKAADGGPLKKVAAANITGADSLTIFALVQCTPDLSPQDCTSCLIAAAADIPNCCNDKMGGRVLTPTCTLRFETFPFYNQTSFPDIGPLPLPAPPPPPALVSVASPPPPSVRENGNSTIAVVLVVIAVALSVILIIVMAGIFLRRKMKQKAKGNLESGDEISSDECLQYPVSTIRAATDDFADHNELGRGGFGAVYKGKLQNDQNIAVKRLSENSRQGDMEFKNEVLLLAKLQHRNLVRLLGFSVEEKEKLLVYEFVLNGSLDLYIFDTTKRSYLDWDKRLKIIWGIARGLVYLHEESRLKIIHRDLKPSNVLLDRELNPKIADFGLARLFGQDETQGNTSKIAGTYGYMAPEYGRYGQFSAKSDVFSFGVIVLEIISGRRNNLLRAEKNEKHLLSLAWKNWREGRGGDIVDPLMNYGWGSTSDILRCIQIGLMCVGANAGERPTMASVLVMLNTSSSTLAIPSEPAFYEPSDDSEINIHDYSSGGDGDGDGDAHEHPCSNNHASSITDKRQMLDTWTY